MLLTGLILGLASLIRPVGQYLILLYLFLLLFINSPWKNKLKMQGSLLGGWLLVVTPWLIRNFLLTGYIFFHSLPGLHFLQYSAAYVVREVNQSDYFHARDTLFDQWKAEEKVEQKELGRPLNEYEHYAVAQDLAIKTMLKHPCIAIKHMMIQIARTCGTLYSTLLLYVPLGTDYGDAGLWYKIKLYLFPSTLQPWLKWVVYLELLLTLFTIVGCGLFGLAMLRKNPFAPSNLPQANCIEGSLAQPFLFLLPIMGMLIAITLGYGCARLRMSIEPLLIIVSAVGWVGHLPILGWHRPRLLPASPPEL